MKRQLIISFFIILFLVVGTAVAVLYGEGYRFDFGNPRSFVKGTGLLVATSSPDGAQVFINGHLTTATNNTLNLAPGSYQVKIYKDGYFPWQKQMQVEESVVSKANATLFPTAPKLESITALGAQNPVIDPSFTKIAFTVASQSAEKNGVYIFDMGNKSLLTLTGGATQIANDTIQPFSTAQLSWSPDSKQLIATLTNNTGTKSMFLLDATGFNATPQDITETLSATQDSWNTLLQQQQTALFNTLKPSLKAFAINNMANVSWSPDETKILYTASTSATMPQFIVPAIIGTDSTSEVRSLAQGNVYIYDTKEDKNFLVASSQKAENEKIMWFPDSSHIIVVHDRLIDIREYDGQNNTTVYAGPFVDSDVFPWATPDQLVILTNLNNPDISPNLYTVSLK